MALRDKIRERAQPFLQPGEQIQAVAMAQSGPSPYWILVATIVVFFTGYRHVVATDRAIYVLKTGLTNTPKSVIATLPRGTPIGPLGGLWTKVRLGDEHAWINRRFRNDVAEMDRLASPPAPAAPGSPLPPPTR